jgi:hypothetical protein
VSDVASLWPPPLTHDWLSDSFQPLVQSLLLLPDFENLKNSLKYKNRFCTVFVAVLLTLV